jgi:polysaccharide biosynthesis protein PslJ
MTTLHVPSPVAPDGDARTAGRVGRRPPLLDPAWPLLLMTVGMPVAYFLGFAAIVWVIPAFAFGIPMILRRSLRVPGMIVPLAILAAWIPFSALELSGLNSLPVFLYRWLLWVSTVAVFLWLCNTSTRKVPTERIVSMLATLWIVLVGFGFLAILFSHVAIASPLQMVMPQSLASNSFIYDLTVIRFAELQTFATGAVPRPAAPLPATNGWGSTLGLLLPFFVLSWLSAPSARRRVWGWVIATAAVVPIAVSTNRGLWLSIAVALVYFAGRRALRGDARPMFAVAMLGALAFTLVLFTPLNSIVAARLDNSQASNATRENVYKQAFDGTKKSPLLGNGAPESTDPAAQSPPIGTHGLMWYVMFCHGFPGLAMLLVALGALFASTMLARTPTALWAHICILICITQVPYYGLLPQIVVVGVAAGIAWRENHPDEAAVELV